MPSFSLQIGSQRDVLSPQNMTWNIQILCDSIITIIKLLKIQVIVAAREVALSSPTPYPFNIAWVASVPVIEEQNA